jgi:uncharacterized membrane protein
LGRVEKSIEIKAPPEKVWEMFAADRWEEWDVGTQKHVKSVEYVSDVKTSEDKFSVGASFVTTDNGGKQVFVEITNSIENERIVYHSESYNALITYSLKPLEKGTEYTYLIDYEMPYGILGKFIDKLFGQRMIEKEVEGSLKQLKNILEK